MYNKYKSSCCISSPLAVVGTLAPWVGHCVALHAIRAAASAGPCGPRPTSGPSFHGPQLALRAVSAAVSSAVDRSVSSVPWTHDPSLPASG